MSPRVCKLLLRAWRGSSATLFATDALLSPTPGACKVPSALRVTLTLVPAGNTVSICAANTTVGPGTGPFSPRHYVSVRINRSRISPAFSNSFFTYERPGRLRDPDGRWNLGDLNPLGHLGIEVSIDERKGAFHIGLLRQRRVKTSLETWDCEKAPVNGSAVKKRSNKVLRHQLPKV